MGSIMGSCTQQDPGGKAMIQVKLQVRMYLSTFLMIINYVNLVKHSQTVIQKHQKVAT